MRYISGLHEGETIRNIYLCKGKRSAETRNGKPYDNVLLQDKTGTLDGKVWDPNSQGIADYDEKAGREVVEWLNDPRVDFVKVDVNDHDATVKQMKGYDIVMDGTTIALNGKTTACIAEAGCHGVNLNGFGEENPPDVSCLLQSGKASSPSHT